MVQSGTCSVHDCIKCDKGLSGTGNHNDIWTLANTCTLTRGSECSVIEESSASDWSIVRLNSLIPVNTRIEFDINVYDGASSDFFCAFSQTLTTGYINGAGLGHFNATSDTWYHMVIDIGASSTTFTLNNATRTITYDSQESVSFYWWLSRDISKVSFKNFEAYPI